MFFVLSFANPQVASRLSRNTANARLTMFASRPGRDNDTPIRGRDAILAGKPWPRPAVRYKISADGFDSVPTEGGPSDQKVPYETCSPRPSFFAAATQDPWVFFHFLEANLRYIHRLAAFIAVTFVAGVVGGYAQSTATLTGRVTDPSGAVVPQARVTVLAVATGVSRVSTSDPEGNYTIASLQPGNYSVSVQAAGFADYKLGSVTLQVDQSVTVDVKLGVASTGEVVQVDAAASILDAATMTVGQVIDQKTVQQIPLNGRHFLDLTNLTPGTVVPPVVGKLTSASRGLGANSFDTAGQREDSVNFMINGVNLNDLSQNQITFQPSINTTAEFKISNSTYSAEYGRSSGSIVNVATRSGTNSFHGEAFDYLRNNYFDARNYFNRKPSRQNSFIRNNPGGAFSGPIWKDHTFFFLSYEGLRQHQALLFNGNVLSPAQRAAFPSSPAGP